MARRRLSFEAIRESLNIECPDCHAMLDPADRERIDGKRVRCARCGGEFVPKGAEKPIRAN